ncbi:MAG: tetratricopeptide repeat protein [bacterium]
MRNVGLILFICFIGISSAFSQSNKDLLKSYAKDKDFVAASKYIHAAITENRKDFDLHILAGDVYEELENLDSAYILYSKANDIEGDRPHLLRKMARTLSSLKKHNDAIKMAKEAVKEDKGNPINYLCLGQVYLAADSMKQAELNITKAREINKNIPDAFIALGDLYFAQRVYELAKNNYEEALGIEESNVEARTKLAISYYWLANREYDEDLANELFKRSLQEWNIITKQDPKNARAFFEQGKILFFSQKWETAAKSLYQYVQLRPNSPLGRWYLAQSLYELAQCDSAEPHLKFCAEQIDTVKSKAYLLLARCYFDAKQYEKSIATFDSLRTLDTLSLEDMERYGAAAFQLGDTLAAIENYKKIIEKDPTRCKLIFKTGAMLFVLNKYQETIDMMMKRVDGCDDEFSAKTLFYIGSSFLRMDSAEACKSYFMGTYQKDSTDFLSLVYLADAFAKQELDDSATYYLDFVIQKTMQDTAKYGWLIGNAYAKICNLYYKVKNYSKLRISAQEWVKYKIDTPIAYLYIATYYQSVKNIESACANYRLVIKYDTSGKLAQIAKEQIQRLGCP